MEFSTFMQLLFPVIGFGSSTRAFTKSMFEEILTDDSGDILGGYSENTYKAYYNDKNHKDRTENRTVC